MGITLLYKLASRATGDRAPAVITQPITDLAAAGSGDIVVDGGWLSFVFSGPADARRVDTNTTLGVLTALTRLSYDDYDTALRGWFESLAAKGVKRVIITLDGPFTVQKSGERGVGQQQRCARHAIGHGRPDRPPIAVAHALPPHIDALMVPPCRGAQHAQAPAVRGRPEHRMARRHKGRHHVAGATRGVGKRAGAGKHSAAARANGGGR